MLSFVWMISVIPLSFQHWHTEMKDIEKCFFLNKFEMLKNFYSNINLFLIHNDILLNASHNIFGIIYRIKENVHQNIRALFAYLRRKMSLKWENFTWSHFDVTDLLNSWMICMIVNLQFATQFFFAYENIQFANDILGFIFYLIQDIYSDCKLFIRFGYNYFKQEKSY